MLLVGNAFAAIHTLPQNTLTKYMIWLLYVHTAYLYMSTNLGTY